MVELQRIFAKDICSDVALIVQYRTPLTRILKGTEKQFELVRVELADSK